MQSDVHPFTALLQKSCVEPLFDQEKKQRIVIIGAGPAGLGAAHRLYELGVLRSKTQVIIFEQSEKAGGLASSYRDQHGFLWDNGAHVVSSRYRYYNDIMQKAISEWNVHSRASSLFKMDSSGKMNFVPCAVMNSTCNERVAEHPNTKKRAAQSLQCEEFLKHNKPVTPTAMSLWGSRCVARQQDLPTVVKTTASLSNDSGAYSPGWDSCQLFHYPKYGGSGAIWKAIARQLPEGWFHYNFTVTGVDSEHRTVYVKDSRYKKSYSLAYDFLINTSPLNQFVGMIDDSDKTLNNVRCLSENLIHSHTHIVGIGLRGRPPDILADKSEIFFDSVSLFYRVTVLSNYADDIVPQAGNFWSLMCEISEQAAKKTVRNKDFIQRVIDVLVNHGLINSEDVVSHYHRSIGNSYPVPFPHIEEFINTIQSWLESKFIYSRGTYGGWDCEVGNQDQSFMQGVEAADLIMRGLLEATHSHHTLVDFFKTDRILDCTPVVVPRYEYVISVYNEDITWAKKDTEHTHIYDKSGGKIDEYLEFFQWQHLPNVGREGHTYLYHIITNYNRLADVTVFLQGAISNHATLVYMDISRYVDEAKEKGLAFKTYGHFSQWNRLRHISKWKVEYEKGLMRKAEKSVGEFWKAIFGTEHPSSVKVAYAACFGVTRKRILAHPKTFYKDLISYVDDHANPEEGHYLERLWPAIFGAK